jgi:hypothetical protein
MGRNTEVAGTSGRLVANTNSISETSPSQAMSYGIHQQQVPSRKYWSLVADFNAEPVAGGILKILACSEVAFGGEDGVVA